MVGQSPVFSTRPAKKSPTSNGENIFYQEDNGVENLRLQTWYLAQGEVFMDKLGSSLPVFAGLATFRPKRASPICQPATRRLLLVDFLSMMQTMTSSFSLSPAGTGYRALA